MKLLFKNILPLALPLLMMFVMVNCDDEEGTATFAKPDVIEISPAEALMGSTVTIKGEDLDKVIKVKFGSIDAPSFTASGNEITATVPDGLKEGETDITVFYSAASESNLGPSDKIAFNVLYQPVLTGVSAEVKPGFETVLSGDFLKRTSEVTIGGQEAGFEASQNEITIIVPADATPGPVEISVTTPGGTATIPYTILERTPEIYSFNPATGGKTGEEVSVNGLFFMDVESVKIGNTELDDFEVVSNSEIKITIPSGVSTSKVTVTTALGSVESEDALTVIEIPFVLYNEGLHSQMQNWSWGGNDEFNNSTVSKVGTASYSRTYNDAWSGIQLHHGTLNLSHYSAVTFSVYGGPGTTGKNLQFTANWGAMVQVAVTEGVWTDYTIPLADIGNPGVLDNLIFQDNGNTGPAAPYTVFIDNIVFIE